MKSNLAHCVRSLAALFLTLSIALVASAVPHPATVTLVVSHNEGDIKVGPDQVTMALDTGLDISRAKLAKDRFV